MLNHGELLIDLLVNYDVLSEQDSLKLTDSELATYNRIGREMFDYWFVQYKKEVDLPAIQTIMNLNFTLPPTDSLENLLKVIRNLKAEL